MFRLILVLSIIFNLSHANDCVDVFHSGMQSQKSIVFNWNSYLTNEFDTTLETKKIKFNHWQHNKTCKTKNCKATGSSRTPALKIEFPSFAGKPDVKTGWGGSTKLEPGTYRNIDYNGGKLYLMNGDYYFKSLTASNKGKIIIVSGTARVFVKNDIKTGSDGLINSKSKEKFGDTTKLVLYSAKNIVTGNNTTLTGFIYSKVDFKQAKIYLKGSLSAKNITIGSSSKLYTDLSSIESVDFGKLCTAILPPPETKECYSDDFSVNNIGTNWLIMKKKNFTPIINHSKLLLTDISKNIATGINLNANFPANNNYIEIEFEHNAYGGNGADGIAMVLSNSKLKPVAGAFGGSLGYANQTGFSGFNGGWIGIGFDEYGNFSNPTEGRNGGVGRVSDSVSIRGGGHNQSGYKYIAGTKTLNPGVDDISSPTPAPSYLYKVIIDTRNAKNIITVQRNTGSGYKTLSGLNKINATQSALPPKSFTLSFTGSTGALNNYHSIDNFLLKAINCGTLPQLSSSNTFVVYEDGRSINDLNISTKIVHQDFNLTIVSLDENQTAKDFNGTVCTKIIDTVNDVNKTNWYKTLFNAQTSSTITPNVSSAIKKAKVSIYWKKNIDSSCPLTNEDNSTLSSDYFAVRPYKFNLTTNGTAYAGDNFSIVAKAYDINLNNSSDYNESTSSLNITATELDSNCQTGSEVFTYSNTNFTNGITPDFNASFSGLANHLNINIGEQSGSEFAIIDVSDTNDSLRYIKPFDLNISVSPYELNITSTEINASTNQDWLYMANIDDMNISLQTTIELNNKNHQPLNDFNSTCYAKDINITFKLNHDGDNNIDVNYTTTNNFSDGLTIHNNTLADINQTITISANDFNNGSATANMKFNVYRRAFKPLNPFKIIGLGTKINGSNIAKNIYQDNTLNDGNITLYYARLKANDMQTSIEDVNHTIEIEVYDNLATSYTSNFPQNSLIWYRNIKHSGDISGNIIQIDATNSSILKTPEFTISPIQAPLNGIIDINITKHTGKYKMHIKTQPKFWYYLDGFGSNYDYTTNSNCTQHPCFTYIFQEEKDDANSISSGNFNGGDIEIKTKGSYKRVGVKLFR